MRIEFVKLPEIAVIGKEGFCTSEDNQVQKLWNEANAHFDEVAALGMRYPDGTYVGFWGVMSDESRSFLPWTDEFKRGLYLAGIETYLDSCPPEDWKKWIMPARTYLVTEVESSNYSQIFDEVISQIIPSKGLKLTGAVCDYTEPNTGKNKLFFPVESSLTGLEIS